MRTINQTIGKEQDIIYVYEIQMDSATIFAATESITLSGITYDGEIISRNSLVSLSKSIDIGHGGTLGDLTNTTIDLIRYSSNTLVDEFFNDFFPATSKPYITSRNVNIGIVWAGATSISDITYISQFYISDYSYNTKYITLTLIEKSEIESTTLPKHRLTSSKTNNKIGYFSELPENNEEKVIPITYGDYSFNADSFDDDYEAYAQGRNGAPILTIKTNDGSFIFCSHSISSFDQGKIFTPISGVGTNLYMTGSGTVTSTNNVGRATLSLLEGTINERVIGDTKIPIKIKGGEGQVINVDEVSDTDPDNYIDITAPTIVSLVPKGSFSDREIGQLKAGTANNYINFKLNKISGDPNVRIGVYDTSQDPTVRYYSPFTITSSTPTTYGADLANATIFPPSSIDLSADKLASYEFFVETATTELDPGAPLRVYYGWIDLTNLSIPSFQTLIQQTTIDYTQNGLNGVRYFGATGRVPVMSPDPNFISENLYANYKGRVFDAWIDLSGRVNGKNQGDLIDNFAFIIESIIRDEANSETNRNITNILTTTACVCDELQSVYDDSYAGGYIKNVDRNITANITSYDFASKTLGYSGFGTSLFAAGDSFLLTNIRDNVDTSTFDNVGTDRAVWQARRCIHNQDTSDNVINGLLYDSWCIMHRSFDKYKLATLDTGLTVGTFNTPLLSNAPMVSCELTSLGDIFTSFTLEYDYHYARGEFSKKMSVDASGVSDPSNLSSDLVTACNTAEINHRVSNHFQYGSKWISDDLTASLFMQRAVDWFTDRRLVVKWRGSVAEHIQYEIGDKVLINYPDMIPNGVNNSSVFIITGIDHDTSKSMGGIEFTLVQLPD